MLGSMLSSSPMPDFILKKIDGGETPLSGNFKSVYDGFLKRAANNRYEEIRKFFNDDISSHSREEIYNKLSGLLSKCRKKEEPIKDNLQSMCYNMVTGELHVPDGVVDIECKISEISRGAKLHIKPDTDEDVEYDDVSSIEIEDLETQKRILINFIIYGCARKLSEKILSDSIKDVFGMDEELPHLYSMIMKINEYLVFVSDFEITDDDHKQGGTVEVQLSNEGELSKIRATGIIFPVLLQETVSGLLELSASYGLPDDKERARRILNVSDALENDPWIMRFGPSIWSAIENAVGSDIEDAPYFIKALSCLDAEEFSRVFRELTAGTKEGKKAIADIYKQSKYDCDYDDFKNDIATKRKENMITDSYFTEDELMEGVFDEED